jgi:hypothetical protein
VLWSRGLVAEPNLAKHQVTQNDAPERTFYVTVTATQQSRPTAKEDMESWCASNLDKLPKNGGTAHVNLNEWLIR